MYKWEYRLGWASMVFLTLAFLGFALQSGPIGIGGIILLITLLLVIPRLTWWLLVEKLGTSILTLVLTLDRVVFGLLHRGYQKPTYFFTQRTSPSGLWLRSAQVLFLVFFSSSLVVPRMTLLTPQDATSEFTEFIVVGIIFLSGLSPALLSVWAYQDSGLRRYESDRAVVTPLGRSVSAILAGLGTLGTFYRFALSVSLNLGEAVAFGAASVIILSPSCLLLTSHFHRKAMSNLVDRLRNSSSGTKLGFKQVSIT